MPDFFVSYPLIPHRCKEARLYSQWGLACIAALLFSQILGCEEEVAPAPPSVRPIKILEGGGGGATRTLEYPGEIRAAQQAELAFKDAGKLIELPVLEGMMILVTVALFNSLRQTLVIWLNVPLSLIGVTAGLLVTNMPFGFMSLPGFLSLIGMLIKNGIVLVDEINLQRDSGTKQHVAIADAAACRLRPVSMAASTTALGMIPLLFNAFFAAMAVTIIAGLVFATVLTMIVLPVFYSIIEPDNEVEPSA